MEVQISFPLAFFAGLVSFLSPCVLPVVPSYIAFVSGMTLGELTDDDVGAARRTAVLYSILFLAAVYWGVKGDFVDFWDAFLWLVAFVFIEMNVFEWRAEDKAAQAARQPA